MPVAARVLRGFFIGLSIGFIGGTGIYLLATAVNLLTSEQVVNPIAFLVLTVGAAIVSAVGIELSSELNSK